MKRYSIVVLFVVFLMIGSTVVFATDAPRSKEKTLLTGGFQGYVRSGSKGISGAIVTARRVVPLTGYKASAVTDSSGYYVIDIPISRAGEYVITAKAKNYFTQTKTAVTMNPLYITVNFNLVKSKANQKDVSQSKFIDPIIKNPTLTKSSKSYFYLKLTKPIKTPMLTKSLRFYNLPAVFLRSSKTPFVTIAKPKLSSGQKILGIDI